MHSQFISHNFGTWKSKTEMWGGLFLLRPLFGLQMAIFCSVLFLSPAPVYTHSTLGAPSPIWFYCMDHPEIPLGIYISSSHQPQSDWTSCQPHPNVIISLKALSPDAVTF